MENLLSIDNSKKVQVQQSAYDGSEITAYLMSKTGAKT